MSRVAIFHPDLGIGGAERLIIEIALALKSNGCKVELFTNYHEEGRCFEETKNGDITVTCKGSWIPRSIFAGFTVYFAVLRMLYLCIYFVLARRSQFDVVVVDQIAVVACLVLKLFRIPTIYYCHYPDMLLTSRNSVLKKCYRAPADYLEEVCSCMSSIVLVNSKFTMDTVLKTFPKLAACVNEGRPTIAVVYPCVDPSLYSIHIDRIQNKLASDFESYRFLFLSINRFERKKGIHVALEALSLLKEQVTPREWDSCHMVVLGGYDQRVDENVSYFAELEVLADKLGLMAPASDGTVEGHDMKAKVTFLRNPSDLVKRALLQRAYVLLYTPENEHFGIVPLEAMLMGVPVIAVGSGGPLETVVHDVTGFHSKPTGEEFAKYMKAMVSDSAKRQRLGNGAHELCEKRFTTAALKYQLKHILRNFN